VDPFVQVQQYELTTSMSPNKLNVNISQLLSCYWTCADIR